MRKFKTSLMRVLFLALMLLMLALSAFADDTAIATGVTSLVSTITGYITYIVSIGVGCLSVYGVTKLFSWLKSAVK